MTSQDVIRSLVLDMLITHMMLIPYIFHFLLQQSDLILLEDHLFPGTQVKTGPDAGTWAVWNHDMVAGRLYTTCMGVLTLETYYRYLPVLED